MDSWCEDLQKSSEYNAHALRDDSYLYCQATEEETLKLLKLLQKFEHASGQKVNLLKSSVFFSSNVTSSVKRQLCQRLQMTEASGHTTYLGLPNMMEHSKSATLGFLKDKVKHKIQN